MRIEYKPKRFNEEGMAIIDIANSIVDNYMSQGYQLTLRQLYYQFVSKDLLPNTQKSYNKLGRIISEARLAGLLSWEAIEDRTRSLHQLAAWADPAEIIDAAAEGYRIDKWANQLYRVEVWIEKEALAGVFEGVCDELQVPFFCCRGYTSQSEMWRAGRRIRRHRRNHKVVVLHFGDHDPSGIDMTRDIVDRLEMFSESLMDVQRLALNMDQIDQYGPPPNPAKITDSRAAEYIELYGEESWELDALEPRVLADLVRTHVNQYRDLSKWNAMVEREEDEREKLREIARNM